MFRCCLLEIFAEDTTLICVFGHILSLPNTKITLNLSNMRVRQGYFRLLPDALVPKQVGKNKTGITMQMNRRAIRVSDTENRNSRLAKNPEW